MRGFDAALPQFEAAGAQVVGMSTDAAPALVAWSKELQLHHVLLSDFRRQVLPKYDAMVTDDKHPLFRYGKRAYFVVRADLEKVRGEYQGATLLMRQKIGSGIRVLFARDGTLFVGMTNRGWGGLSPGHGIARVRWTGKILHLRSSYALCDQSRWIRAQAVDARLWLRQLHHRPACVVTGRQPDSLRQREGNLGQR